MKQVAVGSGLDYGAQAYPRGIHSLIASAWAASNADTYSSAWQATEGVAWIMIGLLILAAVVTAISVCQRMSGTFSSLGALFIAVIIGVILVQSLWVTVMLRLGYLTSIAAGLTIIALVMLGATRGDDLGVGFTSIIWLILASVVMVHTWTILVAPLAVVLATATGLFIRDAMKGSVRATQWLAMAGFGVLGLIASLPPAVALIRDRLNDGTLSNDLGASGASGLIGPTVPWVIALIFVSTTLLGMWRKGYKRFAVLTLILLLSGFATVLFIQISSGSAGELNYYSAKTLWTFSGVVVALSLPGLWWSLTLTWSWVRSRGNQLAKTTATALFLAFVFLLLVSVAGRITGPRSVVLEGFRSGFLAIPYQLPTIGYLEQSVPTTRLPPTSIVWGIVPNASVDRLGTTNVGFNDRVTSEAIGWFGELGREATPVDAAVFGRDSLTACEFLATNPQALRVTGPNPAAGATWLIDSRVPRGRREG